MSLRITLLAAITVLAWPGEARAQFLALSPMTISFPSSDPDTVPSVAAAPVQVTYIAFPSGGRPWVISVQANGHLVSGAATIDISNVTWTATPNPPFANGTLSASVAQTLATGTNLALFQSGFVTFRLANSWNYSAGTYTQTITFTLSTP